jgi:hypothetical protein
MSFNHEVYCGSVRIDDKGLIKEEPQAPRYEGDVLDRLFHDNFVGNGRAAMFRREALVHAEGFDSRLYEAGAQGCEDFLICMRVAEKYRFAVVPGNLVGYRELPDSMSANRSRMLRSRR